MTGRLSRDYREEIHLATIKNQGKTEEDKCRRTHIAAIMAIY